MKSVASSLPIRVAGDFQLFGPLEAPHIRTRGHSDCRRVVERIASLFKKNRTEDERTMRSRFRLRALVLITFLLGEGTFVHAQDWLSKESSPGYRDREAKQVVHSFDYRESNHTIGIDFGGTALMPKAEGHANVKTREVGAKIETHVRGLEPAQTLDPARLTYVLWAVAPDQVQNLGELKIKNGSGMLASFSDLPRFAMMVTAEPYFAVKRPSNYIVLYNNLRRPKTEEFVRADLLPLRIDEKTPLDIYEARNAMRIARARPEPNAMRRTPSIGHSNFYSKPRT